MKQNSGKPEMRFAASVPAGRKSDTAGGKDLVDGPSGFHRQHRIQNQIQISLHQRRQIVCRNAVPVIRHPVLRKIIGADPFAAVPGSNLETFGFRMARRLLSPLNLQRLAFRMRSAISRLRICDRSC